MFAGGWKQRAKRSTKLCRMQSSEFTLELPFSVKREYWIRRKRIHEFKALKAPGIYFLSTRCEGKWFPFQKSSCIASYSKDTFSGSIKQSLNIFTQTWHEACPCQSSMKKTPRVFMHHLTVRVSLHVLTKQSAGISRASDYLFYQKGDMISSFHARRQFILLFIFCKHTWVANSGSLSAINLTDSIKSKVCELLNTRMKIKQLGKRYGADPDHTRERSRKSNDAETENFHCC